MFAIKRLIVNPIPASKHTIYISFIEIFMFTLNSFIIFKEDKIPICFPRNNPNIIPSDTGFIMHGRCMFEKSISHAKKQNIGNTNKFTVGDNILYNL